MVRVETPSGMAHVVFGTYESGKRKVELVSAETGDLIEEVTVEHPHFHEKAGTVHLAGWDSETGKLLQEAGVIGANSSSMVSGSIHETIYASEHRLLVEDVEAWNAWVEEDRVRYQAEPKGLDPSKPVQTPWGLAYVEFVSHADGGEGIQLWDAEDGAPLARATVELPGVRCEPGHVFIKGWSENEGMQDALVEAGIVEQSTRSVAAGHSFATMHKLLVEDRSGWNEQMQLARAGK